MRFAQFWATFGRPKFLWPETGHSWSQIGWLVTNDQELDYLVYFYPADPNFGQYFSMTMENWHMDLYGLIFENISAEDMLELGMTLTG